MRAYLGHRLPFGFYGGVGFDVSTVFAVFFWIGFLLVFVLTRFASP
jgi:hypothetical protein